MKSHSAFIVPFNTVLSRAIEDALDALTEALLHTAENQVLFYSICHSGLQPCHSSDPIPASWPLQPS